MNVGFISSYFVKNLNPKHKCQPPCGAEWKVRRRVGRIHPLGTMNLLASLCSLQKLIHSHNLRQLSCFLPHKKQVTLSWIPVLPFCTGESIYSWHLHKNEAGYSCSIKVPHIHPSDTAMSRFIERFGFTGRGCHVIHHYIQSVMLTINKLVLNLTSED